MVAVEDFLCVFQIEIVLGVLVPRQIYENVHIVHLHREFGRHWVQLLELFYLSLIHFGDFLAPFFLLSLFAEFVDFLFVRRTAKFLLYGLNLLVKKVFALLLVHVFLNLALNFVLQVEELLLFVEVAQKSYGALFQLVGFQ